jgi:hypothetical protein
MESSCEGKGRKLELICLDSGGGGGSMACGISRFAAAGGEVEGVGNPLPFPVCVRMGRAELGVASVAAAGKDGPNTFSKDLSFC